jgi:preprotein translocase subunit SecG
MSIFVIVLHVVVCVALIMIVLLQTGKGADMGAAFGGGGSQTLFGIIFMVTSLGLAYMSGHQVDSSVVTGTQPAAQTEPAPDSGTVPVAPAPPGTATEQPEAPAPKE